LAHVERLISDPAERQHLLDAMAYKVQNPGVKINHALLIGGVPGAGKDSMIAPLLYAIGGENKTNCTSVEAAELQQVWGYFLENEVIIFNELRQSEAIDRRALENRLKPILAAPPELLTVQRKGQHPYIGPQSIAGDRHDQLSGRDRDPVRGSPLVGDVDRCATDARRRLACPVGLFQGRRATGRCGVSAAA
jgi:hypothetical protein